MEYPLLCSSKEMKHAAENYDFHKMQSLLNVSEK